MTESIKREPREWLFEKTLFRGLKTTIDSTCNCLKTETKTVVHYHHNLIFSFVLLKSWHFVSSCIGTEGFYESISHVSRTKCFMPIMNYFLGWLNYISFEETEIAMNVCTKRYYINIPIGKIENFSNTSSGMKNRFP